MVFFCVAPAKCVKNVHVLGRIVKPFMLQYMQDSVDYLEELVLNVLLGENATALKACQVMSRLHPVVPERALKPLNKVKRALLVEAEIHGEVEQV